MFDVFPENPNVADVNAVGNLRSSLEKVLRSGIPHLMRLQRYEKLSGLAQNDAYLQMSVDELNEDIHRKTGHLEVEAGQLKKRLEEIEREIRRYVKALGQGRLSIGRLEAEIATLESDKQELQQQHEELQRRINELAVRDYSAELLQRTLADFRATFRALTPTEQSEALQCVLKSVTVHPHKLDLEVFELEEFLPGSQNRKNWLPGLDSN